LKEQIICGILIVIAFFIGAGVSSKKEKIDAIEASAKKVEYCASVNLDAYKCAEWIRSGKSAEEFFGKNTLNP